MTEAEAEQVRDLVMRLDAALRRERLRGIVKVREADGEVNLRRDSLSPDFSGLIDGTEHAAVRDARRLKPSVDRGLVGA